MLILAPMRSACAHSVDVDAAAMNTAMSTKRAGRTQRRIVPGKVQVMGRMPWNGGFRQIWAASGFETKYRGRVFVTEPSYSRERVRCRSLTANGLSPFSGRRDLTIIAPKRDAANFIFLATCNSRSKREARDQRSRARKLIDLPHHRVCCDGRRRGISPAVTAANQALHFPGSIRRSSGE